MNKIALNGLEKAGDIYIPGDQSLPSFSESNFINEHQRILSFISKDDRAALELLLTIFGLTPLFILKILFNKVVNYHHYPEFIKTLCRTINVGIKGIVCALYFSGLEEENPNYPQILKTIGWQPKRAKANEDLEMKSLIERHDFNSMI